MLSLIALVFIGIFAALCLMVTFVLGLNVWATSWTICGKLLSKMFANWPDAFEDFPQFQAKLRKYADKMDATEIDGKYVTGSVIAGVVLLLFAPATFASFAILGLATPFILSTSELAFEKLSYRRPQLKAVS